MPSAPLPAALVVAEGALLALSFSEVGPVRVAVTRPSSGQHRITNRRACWAVALTLRQPYRCMVPGPWVIVETPTRHHPRRRGRPIPRRLLLGWSERVRIRQRLRAHICAGSGRTPGATPKSNADTTQGDSTRVLRKPASFCAPTRLFRLLAPASRKNLKPHCLRGAFRCVPPRKHLKPCCVRSGKPCTYLAGQLQR
jgi:hypothetical protein